MTTAQWLLYAIAIIAAGLFGFFATATVVDAYRRIKRRKRLAAKTRQLEARFGPRPQPTPENCEGQCDDAH